MIVRKGGLFHTLSQSGAGVLKSSGNITHSSSKVVNASCRQQGVSEGTNRKHERHCNDSTITKF